MQVEAGSAREKVRDRLRIRSRFGSMARVGADDDDDPIPPSSALDPALRAQLKREPWEATTLFVLDWGRMRGMKPKKVREYLDQAWLKLRMKKYPWDTKKQALVERHVCWIIYGLSGNDRTRASVSGTTLTHVRLPWQHWLHARTLLA